MILFIRKTPDVADDKSVIRHAKRITNPLPFFRRILIRSNRNAIF